MEQNSTSAFARLLATEDIRVRHLTDAETASFDVVDRVLTLPRWKNMSKDLYDMLIGHEVAHALWTPGDLAEDGEHLAAAVEIDPDNPMRAMGFLNVVEDARIERLIKDKFPGIRRDFVAGYRWLWENMDLFQSVIEEQGGISRMMLTDRLNLHFKLGIMGIISVPFSDEERPFVERMEQTESWDDVMDLTRDLYVHEMSQPNPQTSEENEVGQSDDGEPGQERMDNKGAKSAPATEDVLGGGLGELRERRNVYGDDMPSVMATPNLDKIILAPSEVDDMVRNPVCRYDYNGNPSESATRAIKNRTDANNMAMVASRERFDAWMRTETKTINYLVKQFELRKAADEHQRTMITKSGRLDPVKMINYKWSEDIFGKNMVVREGKNHGFVFMLDWSGSMNEVLEPTIKQAILLCMFCQKIGVPFDLYAFSSNSKDKDGTWNARYGYGDPDSDTRAKDYWEGESEEIPNPFQMLQFLSSSRGRKNIIEDMANMFFLGEAMQGRWNTPEGGWGGGMPTIHDGLDLGGTPLDEGLVCLHKILPEFRRRTGVQILNCVILTDGDGSSCMNSTIYNPMLRRNFGDHPDHKVPGDRHGSSTNSLLLSLKETTGCNLIGMYLFAGRNLQNCYGWFSNGVERWGYATPEQERALKDATKTWKKENFIIANGIKAFAYDEAYIIAATTEIEDEIEIPTDASHAKMRNAFVKGMAQRSMSRVLSNRLVDRIAC